MQRSVERLTTEVELQRTAAQQAEQQVQVQRAAAQGAQEEAVKAAEQAALQLAQLQVLSRISM